MRNEKIIPLYERLSRDDELQGESNSILHQELLCKRWFLPPNTYDCGSFMVNRKAVVRKESKSLITAENQHKKELLFMKSLFEEMGGTYRQVGYYFIPNLILPDTGNERMGTIVLAMAKQEGVTEALKAADQMEWVHHMNNINNRADEIVLHELVYDQ